MVAQPNNLLGRIINAFKGDDTVVNNTISVDDMQNAALNFGSNGSGSAPGYGWGGGKYPGSLPTGFGWNDQFEIIDLPLIRRRSKELFMRNLFAAGLVRRLVTNEINTGLVPQSMVMPNMVGLSEEDAAVWTDQVEELFSLYANDPAQFSWDKDEQVPMSSFEQELRRGSIILGDMLVIERTNKFGTPSYQLVPGSNVATPIDIALKKGLSIKHGVEIGPGGRHEAYYVVDWDTGKYTRIPARGRRSGRRTAWLVYGSDQRYEKVRGIPLLGIIIQSLKELDTYRDAELRAAVVSSMIAVYMTKEQPGIGSGALSSGAVKRTEHSSTTADGGTREYTANEFLPGMMMTELAPGEKPESFKTDRPNVNYATFETAVLSAIAWSNQIPPEILIMQFSHNYSASKAASSEFGIYLNYIRDGISKQFHKLVYESWLLGMVLARRLDAPGFLEAFRDPNKRTIYTAWTNTSWKGAIKPSVDLLKDVRAHAEMIEEGLITRETSSLLLNGTSFRTNVRTLEAENIRLAKANKPLVELARSDRMPVTTEDNDG